MHVYSRGGTGSKRSGGTGTEAGGGERDLDLVERVLRNRVILLRSSVTVGG